MFLRRPFLGLARLHAWLTFCCLVVLSAPTLASPTPADATYLLALQQKAQTLKLAQREEWRALLHYKVHPLSRIDRSLADDPDFFNAPNGDTDAASELNATLAAFFDPSTQRALGQSASCRFIARFQWLQKELAFDPAQLPTPVCERYQQWRTGINAARATLVFPAAYLNSPASMYGHTFLRLDPTGTSSGAQSPLLSYAINYAANGHESDGLAFAFKGLTGLYAGQFTNAPYYLRIREYNDLENRDIWEYELGFTPAEMDRMLAHVWEVGPTRFDYYFFDENCSYHLLALLDVARPGMGLTDQFVWRAIPVDTVKAVANVPGLLTGVRYRASNSTELLYRANLLNPNQQAFAKGLATGSSALAQLAQRGETQSEQALMLEVAERYTALEATQRAIGHDVVEAKRRELLSGRAALPSTHIEPPPQPTVAPHQGHGTARLDAFIGQRQGKATWQVQARPAYHDIHDVEAGYQRGAGIQFLRIEFSQTAGEHIKLERMNFVDITSLTPYESLLGSKSWRVRASIARLDAQKEADRKAMAARRLFWDISGGPGRAIELKADRTAIAYALIDNQAWIDWRNPTQGASIGTGLALGLVLDSENRRLRLIPEIYAHRYVGALSADYGGKLDARFSLDKAHNLKLQCDWKSYRSQHIDKSCLLGLQRYW